MTAGDTVLTQGSGGVSVFTLQFARLLGARVIATTSTADKAERLRTLGASDVINYKETPDWDEKARELTDGRGVDCVVEIGGPGTVAAQWWCHPRLNVTNRTKRQPALTQEEGKCRRKRSQSTSSPQRRAQRGRGRPTGCRPRRRRRILLAIGTLAVLEDRGIAIPAMTGEKTHG